MDDWLRAPTRRDLMIASGLCAFASSVDASSAQEKSTDPAKPLEANAPAAPPIPAEPWEIAIRGVTGDAKVIDGRVVLDMPEIAENGNVVPFNVLVPSTMAGGDIVRSLRIYSTGNPHPLIATFRFSADSGKAAVSGRVRLAKTQDVIALAELADGTFLRRSRNVKVTIGGCGG